MWRANIRLSDLNSLDTLADGLVVGRRTLSMTLQAALLRVMERIGTTVDLSPHPLCEAYLLTVELRELDLQTSCSSERPDPESPFPTTTLFGKDVPSSGRF